MEVNNDELVKGMLTAYESRNKNAYYFGIYVGLALAHNIVFGTEYTMPQPPEKWEDED